ncbi:MAG: helix-turn-helix domain-containing protein [Crocinitomix sp.]|nr:helix-turn-helix domain-containing protein [Crocinitomix sp.]
MKAVLFKNPSSLSSSFIVQEDVGTNFYDILHYHPEYQLTTINKGEGTLFAGDKIDRFKPDDVFLFSPNLPHVFRNDYSYYESPQIGAAHGISAYFKSDSFGNDFFELPEVHNIKGLLENSDGGIRFRGVGLERIQAALTTLKGLNELERFVQFLNLLEDLSQSFEHHKISGINYKNPSREIDNHRINLAFEYVMKNFHDTINLVQVSEIASMSPASFSRFFKQRTRKTFSRFVNEVRIGNACQLLQKGKHTIYQIAYSSGYNNLSNFNRQFKNIMTYSPREYIQKMNLPSST